MANFQRLAYIRVSTVEQSFDRQLDGMTFDKVFEEKISGRTRERPALKICFLTVVKVIIYMFTRWIVLHVI